MFNERNQKECGHNAMNTALGQSQVEFLSTETFVGAECAPGLTGLLLHNSHVDRR